MQALAELAEGFLYTPAWEGLNMLAVMLGLAGVVALLFGMATTRKAKILAWSGVGVLILSMVFSMLFEEILPRWPQLPAARRLPFLLSFGVFLLFVIMLIRSGYQVISSGLFLHFPKLFRSGPGRAEAVDALRPGSLLFLASAAVFMVSLVGYHGLDVMLGRAGG